MSEFDRTKKSIGLNNLDGESRKDMFEKFKSAGGQVVKDKSPKEDADSKKNKQGPKIIQGQVSRNELDRSGRGNTISRTPTKNNDSSKPSQSVQASYEKELSSFVNRLSIKLKCWFARVTPFGSRMATPAVMGIFAIDLKSALLEMKLAGNELLTNATHSPKISQALDRVNPIYIEVLAMGHKLFDDSVMEDLLQPYHLTPNSHIPLERIKNPLYTFFRKIYLLYPYQDSYKKAAILAYEHLQKLEGKPALIYNSRKKKLLNEVDNLFGTIIEKMYLLVIRQEDKNIPLVSHYMESILGIQQEDKPGLRKSGEFNNDLKSVTESQAETKEEKTKEEKEEKPEIPKDIAYGLKLMHIYSIDRLRKKFDPKGELSDIPDSDKALLTYLLFKEFDDNYSFVMTTKKINLKQVHVNATRVDYRQKLLDQYETARSVLEQFRIYIDTFKEYSEHKANPGSNYIEASKKTSALDTKRGTHSRNIRAVTKEFMMKTSAILQILIQDMRSKKEIVGNMDDNIQFDSVEAKKRLNNKPIKTCITECYCYSKAFAERLESGDLYGGVLEMSSEEMKKSFGIDIQVEDPNLQDTEQYQPTSPTILNQENPPIKNNLDADENNKDTAEVSTNSPKLDSESMGVDI